MPKCPFAKWRPISGSLGVHTSGPFKIVHQTTEGARSADAIAAYQAGKNDPHFTVDHEGIYQHIDTALAARSFGDAALLINVIGYADMKKPGKTLINVAKLCRWLEKSHGVAAIWPDGAPQAKTTNPTEPVTAATNWPTHGGHFGACHIRGISAQGPGYSNDELALIMELEFESSGRVAFSEVIERFSNLIDFEPDGPELRQTTKSKPSTAKMYSMISQ